MSTVVITGSNGFVGSHLFQELDSQGHKVHGFDLKYRQDVRNYDQLRTYLESMDPDYIYHLAAQAWPRESLTDPKRAIDVNVTGALNLLEAVRNLGSNAKILMTGTAEEYGYGTQTSSLLDETSPCLPETPYGVSKLAQTSLGSVYHKKFGLHVVMTRAFNHTGPGQSTIYAVPAFAKRVVEVEQGKREKVSHGDLSALRNYSDVRDVVKAYTRVIDQEPGIYNVCSDTTVSMQTVLDMLISMASVSVNTEQQSALGWSNPENYPKPSYGKLHDATGWTPSYTLEETLRDVLNYWRTRENY